MAIQGPLRLLSISLGCHYCSRVFLPLHLHGKKRRKFGKKRV